MSDPTDGAAEPIVAVASSAGAPPSWGSRWERGPGPISRFLIPRVLLGIVSWLVLSLLIFTATEILPGNVVVAVLGRNATAAGAQVIVQRLHLDQPVMERYFTWLSQLLHGNLGVSLATLVVGGQPTQISSLIGGKAVNSLLLAGLTMVLVIVFTIVLGTLAGIRPGSRLDRAISALTLGAISLPEFVAGTLLILVFARWLDWLPGTVVVAPGRNVLAQPAALVLPVLTLLVVSLASATRVIRATITDVMESDYIEQARLNGYSEWIVLRHALRNSLGPAVQIFAQTAQYLIGGIVVVEYLFNYPGLGAALVGAVQSRDVPFVQGVALLLGACYIVINILADLIVTFVVPKLRLTA
jgi:peptide/nickel transport system permease protein